MIFVIMMFLICTGQEGDNDLFESKKTFTSVETEALSEGLVFLAPL